MGFLSSIGSAFSNVVKTFAPIVKSVASAVSGGALDVLKSVVGSGFDGIKNIASTVASSFPSIAGFLNNTAIPGLSSLQNLGMGGLDQVQQFLSQMLGQPQATPNAGNIGLPSTLVRPPVAQTAPAYAAAAGTNGTLTSAATSALNNSPGSVSALMSQIGNSSSLSPMQQKMIDQLKSDPNADPKQIAMMQLQFQMENMKQLMEMISNISKTLSGISSTITGNMRA